MKTITVNLYSFNELKEQAREKVREAWKAIDSDPYSEENLGSIEAMAVALSCSVGYKYGEFAYFNPSLDSTVLELSGTRALAYIENNFITPNEKGRYYSGEAHYNDNKITKRLHRYSNCTKEFSCPFTGYYLDDCMMDALMWFKKQLRANQDITVGSYINELSFIVSKILDDEEEYMQTPEYLDEMIEANWSDRLYMENGEEWRF